MAELRVDATMVVVRAQAAAIGAVLGQELGVPVTVEVVDEVAVVTVQSRRPSPHLEEVAADLFARVTVGLGVVPVVVRSGPHLQVVQE